MEDELLGATTGNLRGQSDIETEGRRLREEALRKRQIEQQQVLGLGGTDATQEDETLSPS